MSDPDQNKNFLNQMLGESEYSDPAEEPDNWGDAHAAQGKEYMEKKEFAKAQDQFERAIAMKIKEGGEGQPAVGELYSYLASSHAYQEQHEMALPLYEKALLILNQSLGSDPLFSGDVYNAQGNSLRHVGRLDEAVTSMKQGLEVILTNAGTDHPSVGVGCNNLGNVLRDQGIKDEALLYYERALSSLTTSLGPEHAYVQRAMVNFFELAAEIKGITPQELITEMQAEITKPN